jgi:hypothetical protein
MKNYICFFLYFIPSLLLATGKDKLNLDYYLPKAQNYNEHITTPNGFLGFQPGERQIQYFQLISYLKQLAQESDRIQIEQYGATYERRPLFLLKISSPENLKNIDKIRNEHLKLANPQLSSDLKLDKMPTVVWLGYTVHGNESSGANAVPLLVYHLAAAQGNGIDQMLQNMVILVDPCINPDGFNRFTTWVNMYTGKMLVGDPNHLEHREAWPGGRTNHYWFDLNRDWLLAQHPESQGRLEKYHDWLPNILNDHHEMGADATFFFQPGVKSRNNPLIPEKTYKLNQKIAQYFSKSLDEIGSLYFSEEQFDDFYFGKGSTYPDLHGCVGILFEQSSSRGHKKENRFGMLEFPFTVKNQFVTSLASLQAGYDLRLELLAFQKDFFKKTQQLAKEHKTKGYIFTDEFDRSKRDHFLDLLKRHQISVNHLKKEIFIESKSYPDENSFVVDLDQPQHLLIRALFDKQTEFGDSLFYDISSWTLPLAFNLNYAPLTSNVKSLLGPFVSELDSPISPPLSENVPYAYAFKWDDYYAPRVLYRIQSAGIYPSVATKDFSFDGKQKLNFNKGTIVIPTGLQKMEQEQLRGLLQKVTTREGITLYSLPTGKTESGIDIGSSAMKSLEKPHIMLLTGSGVSSNHAGEMWHLLDQRYEMDVSLVETNRFKRLDIDRYNVIIFPSGNYQSFDSSTVANVERWLKRGGTLIAFGSAAKWASDKNLISINWVKNPISKNTTKRRPYDLRSADFGSRRLSGAIFQINLDLTHPLAFGYHSPLLPYFKRGDLAMELSNDAYSTPGVFTHSPLLSGYATDKSIKKIAQSAAIQVGRKGSGRAIVFSDDITFRAFWYGTNKLLANALFFGQVL